MVVAAAGYLPTAPTPLQGTQPRHQSSEALGPPKKEQPGAFDREGEIKIGELSELIGLIYDAALNPEAWPVMLNCLADVLSAQCSLIGSHNSSTDAVAMTAPRTDLQYLRSFAEYWAGRNFIWKRGRNCRSAQSRFAK